MQTLADFRRQFPMYNDIPDEELAKRIHQRWYSDMPFEEVARRLGVRPEMSWAETGMDVIKSAGTGLVEGLAGMAGAVGDTREMLGSAAEWGVEAMGASPETQQRARSVAEFAAGVPFAGLGRFAPTSEDAQQFVEDNVTGELYQPQSTWGEYGRALGQFAPNVVAPVRGGASLARQVGMRVGGVVAPALASETAGQMTEGSWMEGPARVAGAILGADIDPRAATRAMREMRINAPTREAVAAKSNQLYDSLDNANVVFDDKAYSAFLNRLSNRLRNFRPARAPSAADSLDMLSQWQGRAPGFRDLEDMHQNISSIFREKGASNTDKNAARIIMEEFEKFYSTAPVKIGNAGTGVNAKNVYETVRQARDYGRRNILARQIDDMEEAQIGYLSGDESAMRNQFGAVLRSPQRKSLSEAEREAYKKVVRREGALAVSHAAGSRLGQVGTVAAGAMTIPYTGFIGPAIAGAGLATNLAARKGLEVYTKNAVMDARRTVLAGRKAQKKAVEKAKTLRADSRIRKAGAAALGSQEVRGLLSDEPFLIDAQGREYNTKGKRTK